MDRRQLNLQLPVPARIAASDIGLYKDCILPPYRRRIPERCAWLAPAEQSAP